MIENPDSVRTFVSDLIEVSGMTSSAVAGRAGVFRGNLQRWIRGQGQSLGPPGVSKVLSALNVESGHLSSVVVHFLEVKDPAPLLRVLQREGGGVFRMVHVSAETFSPRDFLTLGITVPLFIFSEKVRIVVWQPSAFSVPASDPLLKTGVVWMEDLPPDPFFRFPVVRVPRETFEKIRKRDLSVAEYDAILSPKKNPTWAEVVSACEERGLTPGDVLRLVSRKRKK